MKRSNKALNITLIIIIIILLIGSFPVRNYFGIFYCDAMRILSFILLGVYLINTAYRKNSKKGVLVSSLALIILIIVSVWYFFTFSYKNFPTINEVKNMDEAQLTYILQGYKIGQLKEAWGIPTDSGLNESVWIIDDTKIIVYYNNFGKIVVCDIDKTN